MRRALTAAREPRHRTSPNPRVGCVLLDLDGAELAVGRHLGPGTPHAEVDALARAGRSVVGAIAVVTLEPCHHTGTTGPCTQALLTAGVSRVVYAVDDPNPVAGAGADALRAAGVEVLAGVCADEAYALNRRWLTAVGRGRPYVTWKYAATLDGRSAAADGTSRWITGERARRDVHRLRADADAIVVGTGTVLADDPQLTVRDDDDRDLPRSRQPLRVVVGRRDVPARARVHDDAAPTVTLRTDDLAAVLATLHDREVHEVWLEGGPRLAGAFVAAGLVDEVVAYLAPALLGAGPAALADAGIATLTDALRLDLEDVTVLDGDLRITATAHRQAGVS
ncbi:MAG: bifunctional diaminohydroxyphosphoribosylaminopyrimidine deaminase/5-amino-6-(5-phosphoribosylamino)uracil reductase RibD [Actinomycetota bacterium]|nr:bifunctional diaminohydroxyphosphoribosylaminopyrimidine deaminase/5-amino-6-(5-phosphoribosylamino)uracil reductase RibD [Actinomycetota bacterium]